MAKKTWEYRGRNGQGNFMHGVVNADTLEEAENTAKRMGMVDVIVVDPAMAVKPKDFSQTPPPNIHPPATGDQNLMNMFKGMAADVANFQPDARRQHLVIGDKQSIEPKVETFLARGGRVVSISMRPNVNGVLIFAIVVEA